MQRMRAWVRVGWRLPSVAGFPRRQQSQHPSIITSTTIMAATSPFGHSLSRLRTIISEIEAEVGKEAPRQQATGDTLQHGEAAAGVGEKKLPDKGGKQQAAAAAEAKPATNNKKEASNNKAGAAKDPFDEAFLQVARVDVVERHPDADALYVCQVALGQETRQLVTGLVKHYTAEELQNRLIVAISNLKATKLRGKESNAMLLAADDSATSKKGLIRLLEPPPGASVGDRIYLDSQQPNPNPPASLNHKQWAKVVANFAVIDGKATYKEKALVTKDGPITVPDMVDGSGFH